MATYERYTAATVAATLKLAEEVLTSRLPLRRTAGSSHSITLAGEDGSVTITAHHHHLETLVSAATDRLRATRLDNDVQYFMTLLPYQPSDVMPAGAGRP